MAQAITIPVNTRTVETVAGAGLALGGGLMAVGSLERPGANLALGVGLAALGLLLLADAQRR